MSESIFKASQSTTTILGMYNQFHALVELPYQTHLETTINTKRNVQATALPLKVPNIRYFGIGINGFYNIDDGILAQPYKPAATNMDLYLPIPFRCVPITADLDAVSRANYRMRTREVINDEEYYCYWFKLINFVEQRVRITQITPDNQEIPYELDPSNLNPEPSRVETPDVLDCDTDRVVVSVIGQCRITGAEVIEAINVLHGGDLRKARISEFGFYTGEDRTALDTDNLGNPLQYTEAMYAQLATHRCTLGTDLSDQSSIHEENIIYESGSMVLL